MTEDELRELIRQAGRNIQPAIDHVTARLLSAEVMRLMAERKKKDA